MSARADAEAPLLILILVLFLLWILLVGLLTGWSMWFQGFLYTEPSTGLLWRGPAAASSIMAVIFLWVILDYRAPERFRPLWETSSTDISPRFPELRVPTSKDKEEIYTLRPGTRPEYRSASGQPLPGTPSRIIVVEGERRSTFEPDRDPQGNVKRQPNQSLRYRDETGRVMAEGSLGQLETFRGGYFLGNLIINILFVCVSFVAFWLLARFQWPHALGHAVVLSLLLMLFVLPPILSRAERIAKENAAQNLSVE